MAAFYGSLVQGVKAVVAESFDERHRQALVGVGVLPLEFIDGQTAHGLGLTGRETFTIRLDNNLAIRQQLTVIVSLTAHHCNASSFV